ncbi:MAG TPA: hypothetical protein DDY65_08160 [Ruminococcaceae bacterium]|jgi:hypothetical protein|nr:hypothetical protein [Oscillospiraceae bacterium]
MSEQNIYTLSRETYKQIKGFNREQMQRFVGQIYKNAEESSNGTSLDLDELRGRIGEIKGIGESRLNEIMEVIKEYVNS